MRGAVVLSFLVLFLSGCSLMDKGKETESDSRYSMRYDKAPINPPDVSGVPDAVPVHLPYSRGGNRSTYTVWGKTYSVMDTHIGYREEGVASWYGLKFHGHQTSNGEIYDIYKMTAAHKSLPIPSFARVTNVQNGKQVVVRVNDRGPFVEGRIIDLSYAAAARLDMLGKGTARVRVEAIDARVPIQTTPNLIQASVESAYTEPSYAEPPVTANQVAYLQVGSFGNPDNARAAMQKLAATLESEINIVEVEANGRLFHRVMVGPVAAGFPLDRLIERIVSQGFSPPLLLNHP